MKEQPGGLLAFTPSSPYSLSMPVASLCLGIVYLFKIEFHHFAYSNCETENSISGGTAWVLAFRVGSEGVSLRKDVCAKVVMLYNQLTHQHCS